MNRFWINGFLLCILIFSSWLCLCLAWHLLSWGCVTKTLFVFSISTMCATCPTCFLACDIICLAEVPLYFRVTSCLYHQGRWVSHTHEKAVQCNLVNLKLVNSNCHIIQSEWYFKAIYGIFYFLMWLIQSVVYL